MYYSTKLFYPCLILNMSNVYLQMNVKAENESQKNGEKLKRIIEIQEFCNSHDTAFKDRKKTVFFFAQQILDLRQAHKN